MHTFISFLLTCWNFLQLHTAFSQALFACYLALKDPAHNLRHSPRPPALAAYPPNWHHGQANAHLVLKWTPLLPVNTGVPPSLSWHNQWGFQPFPKGLEWLWCHGFFQEKQWICLFLLVSAPKFMCLHLVYVLTKIVLVTGMGFAPQRGMAYGVWGMYGFFVCLPHIPCW